MCGIVGYVGAKNSLPILINGLKSLEYRGYDSAGVITLSNKGVFFKKVKGEVKVLESMVAGRILTNKIGIAHTRWATHGSPNKENAHPHSDCNGRFFSVHNGIVENYIELKEDLIRKGHSFSSDTDSEVIPHMIEEQIKAGKNLKEALIGVLKRIEGAYALAVVDKNNPEIIYVAKLSSPLVIGLGNGENFIASDPSALVGKVKKVIYLDDFEIAEISRSSVDIFNINNEAKKTKSVILEGNVSKVQKGKYPHFMLKEIFEGADVVRAAIRGRIIDSKLSLKLGGLEGVNRRLKNIDQIIILACGTSYYAGQIGECLIEEISNIPTKVHFASEFRYKKIPLSKKVGVIVISQSGETADTLAALKKVKENGLLTIGVVNVVGSTISRETDAGVYNHAGPEISVASTKAFISQVTVLVLIACYLSKNDKVVKKVLKELKNIPGKIDVVLKGCSKIKKIARKYKKYKNFLYIGRKYNFPTAFEGALKLKEISYIHSEGCGAGEMKHGPIAMIDQNFPTVAIAPANSVIDKISSNLEEIKTRKGPIIAITTTGYDGIKAIADDLIYVPETIESLEPLLTVIPLQLLAYYMGVELGVNVDKPRNLAKSVTVE